MSVPLILTILAGAATFIGAILGVIGQKPSNRVLAFSLGFAAGIMLLISLMEMLPAALATESMPPMLGYGMFVVGLLGYFALDRLLPHAHAQDLMQGSQEALPRGIRRTAILLTLGISLHNFPEGIATYVTASKAQRGDVGRYFRLSGDSGRRAGVADSRQPGLADSDGSDYGGGRRDYGRTVGG